MTTLPDHIRALREALEAAQNALLYIAEQCERHPLYLGDDADEALIVEVGGDAATMTELAHQARAALIAAAHPEAILAVLDALEAAQVDAERYRFIRDADRSDCITPELALYAMESLDEYVDAAMEDEMRNAALTNTGA